MDGASADATTTPPDARSYVDEQVGIAAGRPVRVPVELTDRLWAGLSRREEAVVEPDHHGNFPSSASELVRDGTALRPPLLDLLAESGYADPDRWPNGHRFAAVLSHDVDRIVSLPARARWRQARRSDLAATTVERLRWVAGAAVFAAKAALGRNDRDPFGWYMQEEARFGFHSTFFVLPESLRRPTKHDHWYRLTDRIAFRGVEQPLASAARSVHEAGWEIGLHGSYSSADDAAILGREREQLEAAFGIEITSVRQHFLRFRAGRTPQVHAAAGFSADSTVGFSQATGCRVGLALPFFWYEQPDLLEIPITIQDVGLIRAGEAAFDLDEATARAIRLVEFVADRGGAVSLAWHAHPDPGAYECYRALLDAVARLGGWGCTVRQMDEWWRGRRESLRAATVGDTAPAS